MSWYVFNVNTATDKGFFKKWFVVDIMRKGQQQCLHLSCEQNSSQDYLLSKLN